MKSTAILSTFTVLAVGATAWTSDLTNADRERFASQFLERGTKTLCLVSSKDGNAAKLNKLDRALSSLRRARTEAAKCKGDRCDQIREEVNKRLVRTLDDEAEIFYVRRSLPLATERLTEALDIAPYDERSSNLLYRVKYSMANGYSYGDAYRSNVVTGNGPDAAAQPGAPVQSPTVAPSNNPGAMTPSYTR